MSGIATQAGMFRGAAGPPLSEDLLEWFEIGYDPMPVSGGSAPSTAPARRGTEVSGPHSGSTALDKTTASFSASFAGFTPTQHSNSWTFSRVFKVKSTNTNPISWFIGVFHNVFASISASGVSLSINGLWRGRQNMRSDLINTDDWQLATITYDGVDKLLIYIDDVLAFDEKVFHSSNPFQDGYPSARSVVQYPAFYHQGGVQYTEGIWERSLSLNDVKSLYNNGLFLTYADFP